MIHMEMAAVGGAACLHRICFFFGVWLTGYLLMCGTISCSTTPSLMLCFRCISSPFFHLSLHCLKVDVGQSLRRHWKPRDAVLGSDEDEQPWASTLSAPLRRSSVQLRCTDHFLVFEQIHCWDGLRYCLVVLLLRGWKFPFIAHCN